MLRLKILNKPNSFLLQITILLNLFYVLIHSASNGSLLFPIPISYKSHLNRVFANSSKNHTKLILAPDFDFLFSRP